MRPYMRTFPVVLRILLPLAAGAVIYLFFSPAPRLFFSWLPQLPNTPLDSWIVYALPDGLWAFSFVTALLSIRPGKRSAAIAPLIALLPEFLQGIRTLPGTFDWLDVMFIVAFGGAAMVQWKNFREIQFRFQRTAAIGATALFMIMAMATSPDEPPPAEWILLQNKTSKAVLVTVEEPQWIALDSAVEAWTYKKLVPDSGDYYVFAKGYDYNATREVFYGPVRKKRVPHDSIDKWLSAGKLRELTGGRTFAPYTHDSLMVHIDSVNTTAHRLRFWLFPGASHDVELPPTRYMNDTAGYAIYSFSYFDRKGRKIDRRLRGAQFRRYLDSAATKMELR